jgi:hypothetical protein
MRRRVGRQFRHDVACRLGGQPPVTELVGSEQSGETGPARGGGEHYGEVLPAFVELTPDLGDFLLHITQRGRCDLP